MWTLISAGDTVLLAYHSWVDGKVLEALLSPRYSAEGYEVRDEMRRMQEKAMEAIMESVDIPHYEKARLLVDSYRKKGFSRPELVLDDALQKKMTGGLTMELAIEELCREHGLKV